jgi:hypothetical protein
MELGRMSAFAASVFSLPHLPATVIGAVISPLSIRPFPAARISKPSGRIGENRGQAGA